MAFDPYGGHSLGSSSSENVAPLPTRGFPPRQPSRGGRGRFRSGLGLPEEPSTRPAHHGGLGFAASAVPPKSRDGPAFYRPLLQPVLFVRGDNQELHGHDDKGDGVIPAKSSPESSPLSVDAPVFAPRQPAQTVAPEPEAPLPVSGGLSAGLGFEAWLPQNWTSRSLQQS